MKLHYGNRGWTLSCRCRIAQVDGARARNPFDQTILLANLLIQHPGKVLTHRTLLAAVWGGNYVEQNQYLRVFVGICVRRFSRTRQRRATSSPNPEVTIVSILTQIP